MHTIPQRQLRTTSRQMHIASAPIAALTIATLAAATLTGCANRSMSGQTFPRSSAQSVWNVDYGEVVDVREVKVEGEASLLGILIGSAIGHAAGTEISDSRNAGTVGAAAGAATEQALTDTDALQITVELDSGNTVAIVQDDEDRFEDGERVRVLTATVASAHPAVMGAPGVFGRAGHGGGASFPVTRARVQRL